MASPEFDLIARYFTRPAPGAVLGVGDDCALFTVAAGHELAVSTDTLLSGVHFYPDVDPNRLGHKALASNLSDLAAMGAIPRWFTLALTLPQIDDRWLAAFSAGLFALADTANIRLIGGDTTRGPLSMTLTVMGEVPAGEALRRDAAEPGDEVWVSGTLGDAALGLAALQGKVALAPDQRTAAIDRLERPTPRVALGLALRRHAHAAIDISDGLLADLGHICTRSNLMARIRKDDVPLSSVLAAVPDADLRTQCAFAGGDDYELCFTAPVAAHANIRKLSGELGLALTCIGSLQAGAGVTVVDRAGQPVPLKLRGFDHFAAVTHG